MSKSHLQNPPIDFAEQAERLVLAGKLAAARELCTRMQAQYSWHFQPHYLLGVVCMQEGKVQEAQRHLRHALDCAPDNVDVRFSLAVALQTLGRLQKALDQAHSALRLAPEDAELHRLHGGILRALGRSQESESSFRTADQLEQDATFAAAEPLPPSTVAPALNAERQRALEQIEQLLYKEPVHEVEQKLRVLIAETPDWAQAHYVLGEALLQQDRIGEAEASYRTAIALDSRQAAYHGQLGTALVMQCKLEEATSAYRRALALAGDAPEIRGHLGLALGLQGLAAEGEAQCQLALQQVPHQTSNLVNAARIASLQGQYDRAQSLLEQALVRMPDDVRAHLNLAVLLLKRGDYARGWAEYEWRTRTGRPRRFDCPRWDGSPLVDKTVLIYTEQGIGDAIQFVRFLPMVKQRVGHIVLEHPPELAMLFKNVVGCDTLITHGSEPRGPALRYDAHLPLLSLPALLGIGEKIPAQCPYITTDAGLMDHWRQRLASDHAVKVGIVWAGNRRHMSDRLRSIALENLARLSEVSGVRYYSLQTGEAATQAQAPPTGMPLVDLSTELYDLACTAAVIMNLDLVITVDTSVAHLAGALGKPVWTLLAFDPDWRWLLEREETSWYPTMRLFRQPQPGDWTAVIERVADELQSLAEVSPAARRRPATRPVIGAASPIQEAIRLIRQGTELIRQRRFAEAEPLLFRAVTLHPDSAEAHAALATSLCEQRRFAEGVPFYLSALSLAPDTAYIHRNLGAAYTYLGKSQEAIAHLRQAIALDADQADAYDTLGMTLGFLALQTADLDRQRALLAESAEALRRATELAPRFAHPYFTQSVLATMQGCFQNADRLLSRAVTLAPHDPQLRVSLGMLRLKCGDFKRGWADYEWRLKTPPTLPPITHRPRWDGSPLKGRTILIRTEQGFGDTIQFVRYLPMVKAKGGNVILECQPELYNLLRGLDGCDHLMPRRADGLPPDLDYDLHIELLSLPWLFATGPKSIPAGAPYLFAPADKQSAWRGRLDQDGDGIKVGIVWSGNRRFVQNFMRSCDLSDFAPLCRIEEARFYSLQKGPDAAQITIAPSAMKLIDLSAELDDFTDTAAIIMNLDLVITVDTSVAHLAGALGRPVWTLLALDNDWRWLLDCEESPWYPTMRLFRQSRLGDWKTVMAAVCEALESRLHCLG